MERIDRGGGSVRGGGEIDGRRGKREGERNGKRGRGEVKDRDGKGEEEG